MPFTIRMGMPEMEYYWQDLVGKEAKGNLDKGEFRTFKKLIRSFHHLAINPRHPGLCSHGIERSDQHPVPSALFIPYRFQAPAS